MQNDRFCINKEILFLIISFVFILFFLIFILSNKISRSSQASTQKFPWTCYEAYQEIFFRKFSQFITVFSSDSDEDKADPLYSQISTVGIFSNCPTDSFAYTSPGIYSVNFKKCCINGDYFNNQGTIRCNSYSEGTDYKCKLNCNDSGDNYTQLASDVPYSCEQIDTKKFRSASAYGTCCSRYPPTSSPTTFPTYNATPTNSGDNSPTSTYQPANTPQTTSHPTATLIPASTSMPQPTSTTSITGCQDGATYNRVDSKGNINTYTIKIYDGNRTCVQIGSGGGVYGANATLTNASCNIPFPRYIYKDADQDAYFSTSIGRCSNNYCNGADDIKPSIQSNYRLCNY